MKHLYLLLISALLFASCNKKDAAPPPAESTPKNAPAAASGHASGGSLTLITPPTVTGGQVGPMTVTIKPTGHSDPSLDGNETIVAACTWAAGGQLTIIQSGNTDTSITNLPPGITKIVALKPATDSVTVNSYNINVRINGAWFQNTFSTPLNNGTTSIGLETNTYYNGTLTGGTATYAWVMVGDTTYVRGH